MPLLNDADAIYVGTQPAAAVYAGGEQVWPSNVALRDLILSYNPLNYWPCDDLWAVVPPGTHFPEIESLGSEGVRGYCYYADYITMGPRQGISDIETGNIARLTAPWTILYWGIPNANNTANLNAGNDALAMRSGNTSGSNRAGAVNGQTYTPAPIVDRFAHRLIMLSMPSSGDMSYVIRTVDEPVESRSPGPRGINATYFEGGGGSGQGIAHVAILPTTLTEADVDALQAAYESGM